MVVDVVVVGVGGGWMIVWLVGVLAGLVVFGLARVEMGFVVGLVCGCGWGELYSQLS